MTDHATESALRAFRADLMAGGALRGLALGAGIAACGLLSARAFLSPLPPSALAVFAAVPACVVACALRALSRAPTRAKCLALVEDASHAGGLVLAESLPGADKWPRPETVAPEIPSTWRRALPAALVSLAALAAVSAAPDDWFAAGARQPAPSFPDVAAEIKNEIEELKEAETVDAEELEALKEEIERIEKAADPSAPGETLDAIDAVREKLAALIDIDKQAAKKLLPKHSSFPSLASFPDGAEQLKKMLEESSAGKCPNCGKPLGEGEGKCSGGCGEGDGEGEGEGNGNGNGDRDSDGDKPGSGGVSRGRGDAQLRFGNEAELGNSSLKDIAEKAELSDKSTETKIGESISDEDPADNAPRSAPGARRGIGGRNSGTSSGQTVLPRHRGTVKRFFETAK